MSVWVQIHEPARLLPGVQRDLVELSSGVAIRLVGDTALARGTEGLALETV
jgi:hypothetical protein